MLDSSLEFKQLIRNNTSCSASGKISFSNGKSLDLSGKDFMGGTMQFEHASSSTSSFEIGAAIVGTMSCTLNNSDEKFSEYDFSGAVISTIANKTLSKTTEVIPKGIYNIEKPETIGRTIQIKAYDNMIKFSKSYSDVKTVYPASLQTILNDVCTYCGVILNTQRFDNYNYVISERPDENTITCLDVVSFVAQIAGCFAKINTSGKLDLIWYGTNIDKYSITDGGTFKTASTPYSDGDRADGGNFKDYSSGDNVNGGAFTDKVPYLLYGFSTKKINTDDVVITGIKVSVDEKNSYLYGNDSYALEISNNKFITEKNMKEIATMIGTKVVGMKFRPFSASVLSDPTLEPGDAVNLFVDGNIYFSYLTRTSYTMGNYENVECSAESLISKSCVNYGSLTKMLEAAKKDAAKKISAYDVQMQMLTNLMTNSFGVFKTEEVKEDGSTIYYMHDKPTLKESKTIWKMTADALAVSTDGGKTWNAGIDKDGNAIVNVLSAIGINADWINAGTLTGRKINNGNGTFEVDEDGNVTANNFKSSNAKITGGSVDLYGEDGALLKIKKTSSNENECVRLAYNEVMIGTSSMSNAIDLSAGSSVPYIAVYNPESEFSRIESNSIYTSGTLECKGSKSRIADTKNYNSRRLFCYEMPTPMFGDMGEGILDNTGKCTVWLDEIFSETIDIGCNYHVFTQSYGKDTIRITERNAMCFVAEGTPGERFAWELKAIQKGYDTIRLDEYAGADSFLQIDEIEETYEYLKTLMYNAEKESEEIVNEEY